MGGTGEPRSYCSWLGWCPVGLEGLGLGVRAGSELREPLEGGWGRGGGGHRWGGTGRRGQAGVWGSPKEGHRDERLVARGQG